MRRTFALVKTCASRSDRKNQKPLRSELFLSLNTAQLAKTCRFPVGIINRTTSPPERLPCGCQFQELAGAALLLFPISRSECALTATETEFLADYESGHFYAID